MAAGSKYPKPNQETDTVSFDCSFNNDNTQPFEASSISASCDGIQAISHGQAIDLLATARKYL